MQEFKKLELKSKIAIVVAIICTAALMYISYNLDGAILVDCGVSVSC